jgi:hypothetical protein
MGDARDKSAGPAQQVPPVALTDGGVAGRHPATTGNERLVAPSTAAESNTLRWPLVAVACWRADDVRFNFDSSLVSPELALDLRHLQLLRAAHPESPASIFGHADPVGSDEYNKQLSGRRARAIYGLLVRDAAIWEDLFAHPLGNDRWGVRGLETMISGLAADPKSSASAAQFQNRFQRPDGSMAEGSAADRTSLFLAYMDLLCGPDLRLDKGKDFLAGGADAGLKGDVQGCSEFNPVLIFSKKDATDFAAKDKESKRNEENAPNRRVLVYLFRRGSRITPSLWPCPRAAEGTAGCRKRFWSDGEHRRSFQETDRRRKFEKTRDTFACRFYHRLAAESPCERKHGHRFINWVMETDKQVQQERSILIRLDDGKDVTQISGGLAPPAPTKHLAFDLAALDRGVPYLLEIHAGQDYAAPIVKLSIDALHAALRAEDQAAITDSLLVKEEKAPNSDPLNEVQTFEPSPDDHCPPRPTTLDDVTS